MDFVGSQMAVYITQYGLKVLGAVVILVAGFVLAGVGRNLMTKVMQKANVDPSITGFVKNLTYFLILTFTILAALAKFGVQTTSFVAILGAGAFAIGFALQGSLSDFAAGVLILVLRPFKVGDYVDIAGVAGSVKEIQLFTTILTTPDNVKIIVPNGKIYGNIIKNVSAYETRRLDLTVGIGYNSSIPKAIEVIQNILKSEDRILDDPPPQIAVSELGDSSVNLIIRPWVKSSDYWTLKFELTQKIKISFDENDIEIPFPQRVIHMLSSKTE
ncbi:mechanosensitive ion channel [bacterium]|nr:mechanosensitive ion channel [candidate division CSSED10-310 bacterium]